MCVCVCLRACVRECVRACVRVLERCQFVVNLFIPKSQCLFTYHLTTDRTSCSWIKPKDFTLKSSISKQIHGVVGGSLQLPLLTPRQYETKTACEFISLTGKPIHKNPLRTMRFIATVVACPIDPAINATNMTGPGSNIEAAKVLQKNK